MHGPFGLSIHARWPGVSHDLYPAFRKELASLLPQHKWIYRVLATQYEQYRLTQVGEVVRQEVSGLEPPKAQSLLSHRAEGCRHAGQLALRFSICGSFSTM